MSIHTKKWAHERVPPTLKGIAEAVELLRRDGVPERAIVTVDNTVVLGQAVVRAEWDE